MRTLAASEPATRTVNDVHSQLNATQVSSILTPRSEAEVVAAVRHARAEGLPLATCGSRHAMGGQQFATRRTLLDMTSMDRVLSLARDGGVVTVEAGATWPRLMATLDAWQVGDAAPWSIRQKQTGADRLSLGGALASNIHGRGLAMSPFLSDVEAARVVGSDGVVRRCDRATNRALLASVAGGYGMFGIVTSMELRLQRRRPLRRRVTMVDASDAADLLRAASRAGALYGDVQPCTDERSDDFLRRGVMAVYEPTDAPAEPSARRELADRDWRELMWLAHVNKRVAFQRYAAHYLATDGQVYDSDRMQLSWDSEGYHAELDQRTGACVPGSEMITELCVPTERLASLLDDVRRVLRAEEASLIYSTIRLVEPDNESALPWCRRPSATLICNLHVDHDALSRARAAATFRALCAVGVAQGGTFYLTYHRFASREQLLAAYPTLPLWLARKRATDARGVFASDWHDSLVALLG